MLLDYPRKNANLAYAIKLKNRVVDRILLFVQNLYQFQRGTIQRTLAPHLSYPAAAKTRRALPPEFERTADKSLLRPLSSSSELGLSPSSLSLTVSCFLLHGCQVAPTDLDMQMSEMGPCPTVSSNDRKPSSISSTK